MLTGSFQYNYGITSREINMYKQGKKIDLYKLKLRGSLPYHTGQKFVYPQNVTPSYGSFCPSTVRDTEVLIPSTGVVLFKAKW